MKKPREVNKKVIVNDVICDRCGDAVIVVGYDAFSCDIKLDKGIYTRDGHIGESYDVDLCENCADWLFNEALPNLGITPNDIY